MNKIWGFLLLLCFFYGIATGRGVEMGKMILSLPEGAFSLTITLVMAACFWNGLLMILYDAGFIALLARWFRPVLRRIMPHLKDEQALEFISSNIAANMLGLGYAATPSGLNAMKRLKELSREGDVATSEMVTFLVLNTGGVTLIPTTVLAIRSKYGSLHPFDFVWIGIVSTMFACLIGLLSDALFRRQGERKKKK